MDWTLYRRKSIVLFFIIWTIFLYTAIENIKNINSTSPHLILQNKQTTEKENEIVKPGAEIVSEPKKPQERDPDTGKTVDSDPEPEPKKTAEEKPKITNKTEKPETEPVAEEVDHNPVPIEFKSISEKIATGKCLSILVLGGSISEGYGVSATEIWHSKFMENYNKKFGLDCSSSKINHAKSATGTDWAINQLKNLVPNHDYDLIFVEYGNNDAMLNERAGISRMSAKSNVESAIRFYTEIMVHLIKKQSPGALIWYVEMSWRRQYTYPFFYNAEKPHADICTHYGIPLSSNLKLIGKTIFENPQITQQEFKSIHRKTLLDCCHPNARIHSLTANLIFEDFLSVIQTINNETTFTDIFHDQHNFHTITASDYAPYTTTISQNLEFSKSNWNFQNLILQNFGFIHKYETKKKKYGFIAENKNSVLQIKIEKCDYIFITHLITYENIGSALISIIKIDDNKSFKNKKNFCKNLGKHTYITAVTEETDMIPIGPNNIIRIDGYHRDKSSVAKVRALKLKNFGNNNSSSFILNICTKKEVHGEKFKLLSIITRKH